MTRPIEVLLAEDDAVLSSTITEWLSGSGFNVSCVQSGTEASRVVTERTFDFIILDLGLPGLDGMDVLKQIRERPVFTPVMIITARDSLSHKLSGLNSGADDYLTKPFELAELEARIRSILRRRMTKHASTVTIGNLTVDKDLHTGFICDEKLGLTPTEYKLLLILVENAGSVVEKDYLQTRLGEDRQRMMENTLEVNIYRLRKKLDAATVELKTIRGIGYSLTEVTTKTSGEGTEPRAT